MAKSSIRILNYSPIILVLRILAILVLYSISRAHFYWSNQSFFGGLDFEQMMLIFKGGFRFDVVSVLYINLIYILINLFPGNHHNPPPFS